MKIKKYKTWQDQVKNTITSVEELSKYILLTPKEKDELQKVVAKFPMRITPHYLGLINLKDRNDPIRLQIIPNIKELIKKNSEELIAWDKESSFAVIGIEHKYPDRVAFLVTRSCAAYCRFCVRKVMCENVKGLNLKELTFEEIN